ncbi:helix-turn-helix domain-containing protein [Clostridium sp. LP20]|uniref:helix-turn-helix domain-containing protein n=1 Tax=Clostridium sp. LP20 TaxID=3418665 RepID=UPI003EE45C40
MKSLIKTKRLEVGLMQYAVASKLGMSTRNYQRIENEGKEPTEEQMEELALIFNCDVANLRQKEA